MGPSPKVLRFDSIGNHHKTGLPFFLSVGAPQQVATTDHNATDRLRRLSKWPRGHFEKTWEKTLNPAPVSGRKFPLGKRFPNGKKWAKTLILDPVSRWGAGWWQRCHHPETGRKRKFWSIDPYRDSAHRWRRAAFWWPMGFGTALYTVENTHGF